MSFHLNDLARRSRAAALLSAGVLVFLLSGFFRTQVLQHRQFATQSEENRLRATLTRLGAVIPLSGEQVERAVRRWRQSGSLRPTLVIADATFDVVSVLEENTDG